MQKENLLGMFVDKVNFAISAQPFEAFDIVEDPFII